MDVRYMFLVMLLAPLLHYLHSDQPPWCIQEPPRLRVLNAEWTLPGNTSPLNQLLFDLRRSPRQPGLFSTPLNTTEGV